MNIEHAMALARINDIAALLKRGHFAAAKYLWDRESYTAHYMNEIGVPPYNFKLIIKYLLFLQEKK